MRKVYCLLYFFLQCTWGIPQTLLGFIYFLKYMDKDHSLYHCSILTKWDRQDGISLGLFIFVPNDKKASKGLQGYYKKIAIHEYGHTIQSLILGPLYLPIIGIVSLFWSTHPGFKRMRQERNLPYSYCFTEKWADTLGEQFTSR